ncbi:MULTISPECIES: divalent-cation tolerance protein CutA [Salinibaculum]|uniref:divalent-cation tolerance protein CutA n=1 Tax=Salinibaculum TaxID=2732368 RepID=UPI0030CABFE7
MPTVYITAPEDAAAALAESLVEDRLAACVNRVPCRSVYRWEGEVVDDEEVILLAKTTAEQTETLVESVVENHPYDVPCIEVFEEDDVLSAFADWRADSVRD